MRELIAGGYVKGTAGLSWFVSTMICQSITQLGEIEGVPSNTLMREALFTYIAVHQVED